jgi:DNA polymerase (family 10)
MELAQAQKISEEIVKRLSPYCKKIVVVGSIINVPRERLSPTIVLIPSDPWNLTHEIMALGPVRQAWGEKLKRVRYNGVQIDIYYATEETWAMLLLIRTGSMEHNVHLAGLAKKMGWRLAANGDGLFNQKGQRVAGDTEESIYAALGLPYKEPWERD